MWWCFRCVPWLCFRGGLWFHADAVLSVALALVRAPQMRSLQLFGLLQPTVVCLEPVLLLVLLLVLPQVLPQVLEVVFDSPVPLRAALEDRPGLVRPSGAPRGVREEQRDFRRLCWETFDDHTSARVPVRRRLWLLQPALFGIRRQNCGCKVLPARGVLQPVGDVGDTNGGFVVVRSPVHVPKSLLSYTGGSRSVPEGGRVAAREVRKSDWGIECGAPRSPH